MKSLVTGVVPFSRPVHAFIFIAQRVPTACRFPFVLAVFYDVVDDDGDENDKDDGVFTFLILFSLKSSPS